MYTNLFNIATKGVTNYLMKAKAKLRRPRRGQIEYEADLSGLRAIRRNSSRSQINAQNSQESYRERQAEINEEDKQEEMS